MQPLIVHVINVILAECGCSTIQPLHRVCTYESQKSAQNRIHPELFGATDENSDDRNKFLFISRIHVSRRESAMAPNLLLLSKFVAQYPKPVDRPAGPE